MKTNKELKFRNYRNIEFQNDWKKFWEDNFIFEILSDLEQKCSTDINYIKELALLEEMLIDELNPFGEKGYNSKKKK